MFQNLRHSAVLAAKRILFARHGEPYQIGDTTLRFEPGMPGKALAPVPTTLPHCLPGSAARCAILIRRTRSRVRRSMALS